MRVFCCRWQNGDISFVAARNKEEAVLSLDEVGNAEASDIFPSPEFMLHLRLGNDGRLRFQGFEAQGNCGTGCKRRLHCRMRFGRRQNGD